MSESQRILDELIGKEEDLIPELEDCVVESGLGLMIANELVHEVFYVPALNARYNYSYKLKSEKVREYLEAGELRKAIFLYERPYRFEKLFEITFKDEFLRKVSPGHYWRTFWFCWTDTENMYQNRRYVKRLLGNSNPMGPLLRPWECDGEEAEHHAADRKIYDSLPDEIVIYRGHDFRSPDSHCWTLSASTANWFANRLQSVAPAVSRAKCRKTDVLAVLNGRLEMELVVDPRRVYQRCELENQSYDDQSTPLFELVKDKCLRQSIHGHAHWFAVLNNAMRICDKLPDADRMVCEAFAILHDCCRVSDGHDPEHGERAADYIMQNFVTISDAAELTDEQMKVLIEAVRYHNEGKVSDDPTIGACWDADRLDLPRVGKLPSKEFFSSEEAFSLLWTI